MGAPLVEEPVTAEEARELIGKARAIVEADMGVKVHSGRAVPCIVHCAIIEGISHGHDHCAQPSRSPGWTCELAVGMEKKHCLKAS